MSSPTTTQISDVDQAAAMSALADVLARLQESHRHLEERALHVESELCRTNDALEAKVDELARVKQHLEAVLAAIPTGVVVYDDAGTVVRVNDAAAEILGREAAELDSEATIRGFAGDLTDGTPRDVERSNGEVRVVARRRSPLVIEDSAGTSRGAVEVIEDQTALVRAQERLHRLDKTAALGTMAGGIAHEIRNPLHAIQGFAELLCREVGSSDESGPVRHARRIREGVAEIEAIVASMLGIAGEGGVHVQHFDLRALLEEAIATVRRERPGPDRWSIELDADALDIAADRMKLRQAVRNLVANACDAQPTGGRVLVRALPLDGTVQVLVADDGPGVAPADAQRLTDPFFTTRADGTGLGLALVQRVAELHHGSLELVTAPAPLTGAAFALDLHTSTPAHQ